MSNAVLEAGSGRLRSTEPLTTIVVPDGKHIDEFQVGPEYGRVLIGKR